MEKILTVKNASGLHARPAGMVVKTASKFNSDISFEYNGKTINAKSIMGVMSLGLGKDNQVKIIVKGSDQEDAINAISELFETGFGEI